MNDDAAALLDRLTSGLPDPGPPVGLLAEGRRRVRRRRRARLGAGLATVVVAVAGAAVVPQLAGSGDGPAPTDRPDAGLPAPPEGTRWVGHGDVVLAVPEEWSTGDVGCFGPMSDTVYLYSDVWDVVGCISPRVPGTSSLEIRASDPIEQEVTWSDPVVECATRASCSGTSTVYGEGLVLTVTTRGDGAEAVATGVLDSIMLLPGGWATVPWPHPGISTRGVAQAITDAGLVPDVDAGPAPRDVAVTLPAPGTPVRVGSAVRVFEPPEPSPTLVD